MVTVMMTVTAITLTLHKQWMFLDCHKLDI